MAELALKIGGKYNWRNQAERLAYMGIKRYLDDALERTQAVYRAMLDAALRSGERGR